MMSLHRTGFAAVAAMLLLCACPPSDDDDATPADDDDTPDVGDDDDATDPVDADGDGATADVDCDDDDPANYPGNVEACDGADNDCDGAPAADEVDADADGVLACAECDDADPAAFPDNPEVCDGVDNDCDGAAPGETDEDGDGFWGCEDCDDSISVIYPGAPESCDGLDRDCDGTADHPEPVDGEVYWTDGDGDGYGDSASMTRLCAPVEGVADNPDDCDDTDATVSPDDNDGDGLAGCSGDCDDTSAAIQPGVDEVCDGADTDCDGSPLQDLSYTALGGPGVGGLFDYMANLYRVDEWTFVQDVRWEGGWWGDGGDPRIVIYEGATQTGTFTAIADVAGGLPTSSDIYPWMETPGVDVLLFPGMYYVIGVYLTAGSGDSTSAFNDSGGGGNLPQVTPFGEHLDGFRMADGPDDEVVFPNGSGFNYRIDLVVADEADADGDGHPACSDCDDADPSVYPGNGCD